MPSDVCRLIKEIIVMGPNVTPRRTCSVCFVVQLTLEAIPYGKVLENSARGWRQGFAHPITIVARRFNQNYREGGRTAEERDSCRGAAGPAAGYCAVKRRRNHRSDLPNPHPI